MGFVQTPGKRQVEVLEVAPDPQTSTNDPVVLDGSEVDARPWSVLSVTAAVATNDVTVTVHGANAADYSDEVTVDTMAISAGAVDTYTVQQPPYAYYRIKVESTADGNHGDTTGRIFGR